jgi:hypothetical protein
MSEQGEHKVTETPAARHASPTCWPSSGYWRSPAASPSCSTPYRPAFRAADVRRGRRPGGRLRERLAAAAQGRTAPLAQRPGHLPRPPRGPGAGLGRGRPGASGDRAARRAKPRHRQARSAWSRKTSPPCTLAIASSIRSATPGERRRSCTSARLIRQLRAPGRKPALHGEELQPQRRRQLRRAGPAYQVTKFRAPVGLVVLKQQIDTTTPTGRLVFHILGAIDGFQRELIVEGIREGLHAVRGGCQPQDHNRRRTSRSSTNAPVLEP